MLSSIYLQSFQEKKKNQNDKRDETKYKQLVNLDKVYIEISCTILAIMLFLFEITLKYMEKRELEPQINCIPIAVVQGTNN